MAARKSKPASSRSQTRRKSATRSAAGDSKARRTKNARSRNTKAASRSSSNGAMGRSGLAPAKIVEFLSQMLAVEKGGVMLYEKALEQLSNGDLREDLEEFLEQTRRHVELCEEMLDQTGAGAQESTPAAEAAEAKAKGLISVQVPEEMKDFNNIENLVLAETKDHWNWETLAEISKSIKDRELRSVISRAVREVSRQERHHVDWNTRTLSELAREMMQQHAEREEEQEEEMEEERM